MSDETCPRCHRPFATTAHEQAYPAWCNGGDSYGCLRAQLADAERRLAQAERVVAAADVIVAICDRKTDAFDAYKTERAKMVTLDPDAPFCGCNEYGVCGRCGPDAPRGASTHCPTCGNLYGHDCHDAWHTR